MTPAQCAAAALAATVSLVASLAVAQPAPATVPPAGAATPPQPATRAASRPAATAVPKPVGRPMVCLVLSGGGARGAAHIGVIRVLEELRVPIDCITGTSMGSLVGGAYASGMTLAEMEKLTERITVDLLFRETPPRYDLTIRRKQDDTRLNLFSPEFGVDDEGRVMGLF